MSEQIKKLAEFCGLNWFDNGDRITHTVGGFAYTFNPFTDANDTLLVETRLREKGLELEYMAQLYVLFGLNPETTISDEIFWATLEQRMTAALQVIQESNDE